ncbi:MAG: NAD-dependent deacylase [bacterium]|nr:NAD-dependent deacylase [bacterium]
MPTPLDLSHDTINALRDARSVVVLTGAGVSAESGVPTFRGEEGLWRNFSPQELATPEAFNKDPNLVWEWYDWRRGLIAPLEPNPAHLAIVALEERSPTFTLITQNIDGLHQRAGSQRMLELHGNIWNVRCLAEGTVAENREVPIQAIPPYCSCGAMLRPHIVWFGESLDPTILHQSLQAIEDCDFLLVVGTSAVVQPSASFPGMALQQGATVLEVNLEPTPISSIVNASLFGKAGELLPQLLESLD